jgi:hypothetical protein
MDCDTTLMSHSSTETTDDGLSIGNAQNRRSYILELIGAVSVIGFFVGILFAYRTQVAGVVTQSEFDQLQPGQSVEAVNELLGFEGVLVSPEPDEVGVNDPAAPASSALTYVWENSSISYIRCDFVDDRLTNKTAQELP